ncbi:helix-turn-helix transcriptional regulator [Salinisphaera orenii]|uniref:helix-turn-helix transcriptional regulator n=1 Tax=Salinisphaera orenii TaxID=856731 RepID=UPI00319DDF73
MKATTLPAVQPRFYSASSIAKVLDVHPSTVWRWADKGLIAKPIKLSAGVTRWRAADVEAMFQAAEGAA